MERCADAALVTIHTNLSCLDSSLPHLSAPLVVIRLWLVLQLMRAARRFHRAQALGLNPPAEVGELLLELSDVAGSNTDVWSKTIKP